jgi:hypothetical protein
MLWASEPGLTYAGVGIGNNVNNWNTATSTGGISRISNLRGGSYICLLDNSINFNLVSNSGTDESTLTLKYNGHVGIGVQNSTNKLTVQAGHLDSNILLHSTGDGINESNRRPYAMGFWTWPNICRCGNRQ